MFAAPLLRCKHYSGVSGGCMSLDTIHGASGHKKTPAGMSQQRMQSIRCAPAQTHFEPIRNCSHGCSSCAPSPCRSCRCDAPICELAGNNYS